MEQILSGITLGKLLGQGSFGSVYQAKHEGLAIDIAVKQIKKLSGAAFSRGLAEARLMARLDHPNLLRIYDVRQHDGSLYLLCEMMNGGSLEEVHSLSEDELSSLASQLLSGLQALHQAKVLHRDLKPANFLRRSTDGRVKLADLGIAIEESSLRQERSPTGTLPFMAPELFETPPRFAISSDLYALGLSLLCLALPSSPYPHGSWQEVIHWIATSEKPSLQKERSDISKRFSLLVDQLCHPDPEKRPGSAGEALAWLSRETRIKAPKQETKELQVGPWVVGQEIYRSRNWLSYAVTHYQSGTSARLCFLQKNGPLAGGESLILASAERASKLSHRGLLPVLDWGVSQNHSYVVTASQGSTLQSLIDSSGPLSELEALRSARQISEGLSYLHQQGFVYQMVEPGSTHVAFDGRTVQLSWPVFCVPKGSPYRDETGKPLRVYVPRYAAPEAVESSLIDPLCDIYGIGQLLFFFLAGYPLHQDESMMKMFLLKAQPPNDLEQRLPMITKPTIKLIESLLQPDPTQRPQSAKEVAEQLQRVEERLALS